ncbi:hypothetical protein ABT337_10955 [Saccharopolyspora hirsuta]|uniref:DUF4158 domain-containing protein n=1 Tax=Saccharopolyspora hirsuta TaxID=1837 RepID=UPI001BA4BD7C|nr:hypothetical protein [Saccharopolyspora hirsuta]
MGIAVALCSLPWLGFVPDDVTSAPRAEVVRLAVQLGVDPGVIRHYGPQDEDPHRPAGQIAFVRSPIAPPHNVICR